MGEERSYYLEKYEKERESQENTIKNAELCDQFSKNSSDDRDIIFWKKKGLEIREKVFGKKGFELGDNYDSMAELYMECGKYKSAKLMCEKALNVKLLDETGQSNMLKTYAIMILNYISMDDYENAIKVGEKALQIKQVENKNYYNEVIVIHKYMAWAYSYSGNETNRNECINQALCIAIKYFEEDSVQAAEMYVEKANFILKEKNDKLELLKKALIILFEHFGFEDDRVTRVYRFIWQCWKEDPDCILKANEWLEENVPKNLYNEIQRWRMRNGG